MACLLACTSVLKVVISCRMVVIPVFTDWMFVLLAICIVLVTFVMVVMLSSLPLDSSCAFAIVPGLFTPLPEINRFSYASPKCDLVLPQSWLNDVKALYSFRWASYVLARIEHETRIEAGCQYKEAVRKSNLVAYM